MPAVVKANANVVPGAWLPESNRPMPDDSVTLWWLGPSNNHRTVVGLWAVPVESAIPCDAGRYPLSWTTT